MEMQGQTVIVTGGASGIGKATAFLLAREGFQFPHFLHGEARVLESVVSFMLLAAATVGSGGSAQRE